MKKIIISLLILVNFMITTQAQTTTEDSIRACLNNYLSDDASVREKAFHPSASMKYVDIATGEYKDVPIADFIKRIKENKSVEKTKKEIVSINYEGTAASAKIKIEGNTLIFLDYMNLLKIDGEWKIVSKIFYRINK
jgi:Putative lumazine-binding